MMTPSWTTMFTEPYRIPRSEAAISRSSSSVGSRPLLTDPVVGGEFWLIAIVVREWELLAAISPVVWLIVRHSSLFRFIPLAASLRLAGALRRTQHHITGEGVAS